jgi:hypothetical protein
MSQAVESSAEDLELVRFKDPNEALGLAVHLLAKDEPLNELPLGQIVPLAEAAIHSGHYVFAKRDGKVWGLLGWGYSDFDSAEAWVKGQRLEQPVLRDKGPCVLLLCLQSETAEVANFLTRAIRDRLFPEHHLAYYIRVKKNRDGRIVQKGVRLKRPGSNVIIARGGKVTGD